MTPVNPTDAAKGFPLPGWVPAARQRRKCGSGDHAAHLAVESSAVGGARLLRDGVVVATGKWSVDPNRGGKMRRRDFVAAVKACFRVAVV